MLILLWNNSFPGDGSALAETLKENGMILKQILEKDQIHFLYFNTADKLQSLFASLSQSDSSGNEIY